MDELALRTLVTSLEASRSSDHWWLEVCTALVAIGVLFEVIFVIWEYVDELHDFRRGIVHPPERPNMILFALGLFGAGLVAIGVAGEFRFEAKIESTETRIRKANDDLFLLLSKEAGDAAASAKTAHNEADAAVKSASDARLESDAAARLAGKAKGKAEKVGKTAEEVSARLDTASQQLSQVEHRVRAQGPRWQWLEDNKSEFIEAMKPFAGSITTVRCGSMPSPEQIKVEVDLFSFSGKDGAGWKTTNMVWPKCPEYGFSGFLLIWSESATTEVNSSATGLMSALRGLAFPRFGYRVEKSVIGVFGTDSPFARALSGPTTIFVVVGPNSMEDLNELEHPNYVAPPPKPGTRIPRGMTLTPSGEIEITFKPSHVLNQTIRNRIRHDLTRFQGYLVSLGIPVPIEVPPFGIDKDTAQLSTGTPPGLPAYRSVLSLGDKVINDPTKATWLYCDYVVQNVFFADDSPLRPAVGVSPHVNLANLLKLQLLEDSLTSYLNASFWNRRDPEGILPLSASLWEMREKFGREFTDQMVRYCIIAMNDNPTKDTRVDLDSYFVAMLKIGDSVVDDNVMSQWSIATGILEKHGLSEDATTPGKK